MKIQLKHLPNVLTMIRIVFIPVMAVAYYLPWGHFTATFIFFWACITDWFDGYLARSLNLSTPFGAFLDPVADKLIVATALVMVTANLPYLTLAAAIIIGREIVISALREWMAEMGKRASVAVSFVSKIKTTMQMIAIGFLLAAQVNAHFWILNTGYILIYIAAILTIWTMLMYLRASWTYFFSESQ